MSLMKHATHYLGIEGDLASDPGLRGVVGGVSHGVPGYGRRASAIARALLHSRRQAGAMTVDALWIV
jgi:hypothetical protein